MANKQIKPSKGDYNALGFLVQEFHLKGFKAWRVALAKTPGPHVTGLAITESGWDRRLRRLITLGWVVRTQPGWYAVTETGRETEEDKPF